MKNLLLVLPMFIMAASFTFSQGDSIVQATILTEAEIQADVKYNEGVALLHSKNYSEAVNAFSEAITLKNPFSLAHLNRGSAQMALEKYSEAIQDFNVALNEPENSPNAHYLRGTCYLKLGDKEKAEGDFKSEIQKNPKDDKSNYYLGVIQFERKEYQEAI